jgi:hypothetical protein
MPVHDVAFAQERTAAVCGISPERVQRTFAEDKFANFICLCLSVSLSVYVTRLHSRRSLQSVVEPFLCTAAMRSHRAVVSLKVKDLCKCRVSALWWRY